jgi:H+/Cl- antiporter ClcA
LAAAAKEQRRQNLIAAAGRCLARAGYRNLSVDDVCAEAGQSKDLSARIPPVVRVVGAGAVLVGLALASKAAFGDPLTLGAGYDNLTWAFDPRRAVALVLLLFVLRAVATFATVSGP